MIDIAKCEKELLKARARLLIDHPFFGSLVLRLSLIQADDLFPTMATDGRHIYWNSSFVSKFSNVELQCILAHEILHCVYMHFARSGKDRLPFVWNVAGDYVINADLIDCGFSLPKNAIQPNPKWKDWSTEEVYRELQKSVKTIKVSLFGSDLDPGGMGGVIPAPGLDKDGQDGKKMSTNELATDWRVAVREAAMAAHQKAGKLPGSVELMIKRLLASRVDWRDILRRFIDDSQTRDWSWTRPNRRFAGSGLILPGAITDGIHHIIACMDTSGSIVSWQDALTSFASELDAIMGDGNIDKLSVIYIDAAVQKVEHFERGDEIILKPKGGGGTMFHEAFQLISKEYIDSSAIIFFSDLETASWGTDPGIPVLWVMYGSSADYERLRDSPPFGLETIHCNS